MEVKYLILKENGYDGWSVNYCDSKKKLNQALQSTDYVHFSFPIEEIEVYEVTRELTTKELLEIKGATNA